jgi:hypothetical protein
VSGTVCCGQAPGQQAEAAAGTVSANPPRRGRRAAVWLVVVLVLAAGGALAAWGAGAFARNGSPGPVSGVDNGIPVVLLYGSVPDWRAMSEGTTGADVTQLNHDLVRLGYASSAEISALGWDYYSGDTGYGVQRLRSALGISRPSASLPLGSVVFEPEALRVAVVSGSLGSPASGPVLAATSDRHVVTIDTVTLPDGTATPGVITSVGTVASGSGSSATIPVYVALTRPQAAGSLDQAPVTVQISSANVSNVLVVPVGALLAQPSGRYAVEVTGPGNTRHLVPVAVGIFDDTDGLVQVTGALTAGQRVVVPAS